MPAKITIGMRCEAGPHGFVFLFKNPGNGMQLTDFSYLSAAYTSWRETPISPGGLRSAKLLWCSFANDLKKRRYLYTFSGPLVVGPGTAIYGFQSKTDDNNNVRTLIIKLQVESST